MCWNPARSANRRATLLFGGGAVFGSIQPQTVPMLDDGLPDPAAIAAAVKPDDSHYARTKLVCVENMSPGVFPKDASVVAARRKIVYKLR